ncbi:MAG TPA: TonB-dependent receptor [Terriglobales bacterium]|nr:TonB-dependent receptor [Terriglobales bacterium]
MSDQLLRRFAFLCSIFALLASAYASQIKGTITDPVGAVITGATVQLISNDKLVASGATDSQGQYRLDTNHTGRVHLRVTAPGFAALNTAPFYVNAGTEIVVRNVFLNLKNVSQHIVVTATGVPTSQAQVGAAVDVLGPPDSLNNLDILEPLQSLPGLQLTQTGQHGGTTALFIRGGNSDANKVLIDGVPINDIGGEVEFGDLSLSGIDTVEVLRGSNSVLYGADALAGVVSLTTKRGVTPLPQLQYQVDGGNFGTYRQEGTLSGAWKQFDYFSSFARFDSSNSVANNQFHNGTFSGNFGWTPSSSNNFRVTVRRIATGLGLPNATDLLGLSDNAQTRDHDLLISATYENQPAPKWHNLIRYGSSRLDSNFDKPAPLGILLNGFEFVGLPVTIHGANGFSATGQALLSTSDCCPSISAGTAKRDFVYAQTDYQLRPSAAFLLGYRYEAERGISRSSAPAFNSDNSVDRRNMSFIMETHGEFWNRLFYSAGGAIEKNEVFGTEATPRLSFAYYPIQAAAGVFRSTKLTFNFGKGIKEPSIFDETSSLFDLLREQPGGEQLIQKFGIKPIGAELSRTYDFGVEESLGDRARVDITLFHNQFTSQIEFVDSSALQALGIPPEVATATGFGATVNSSDFLAQGVEGEIQYRISNSMVARGGYTYLDARVERSFSSDALSPATNPLFPGIPIGAFGPLVGARPFRRAPHTGFLSVTYNHSRLTGLLQGTFVGRRDDSTFLLFSDANFGNTLLLPNRNLDSAYQKLDLSGSVRINSYLTWYLSMENLLSQRYDTAFGFPSLPFTIRAGLRVTLGGEAWHHK